MVTPIRKRAVVYLYIEEHMAALGLNDEDVGEKLGKSRTTIWRWRTDQKRLDPFKIADLARAMKIEPDQLWRPPGRPSIDAMLKKADDDVVQEAAAHTAILLRRGATQGTGN